MNHTTVAWQSLFCCKKAPPHAEDGGVCWLQGSPVCETTFWNQTRDNVTTRPESPSALSAPPVQEAHIRLDLGESSNLRVEDD